MRGDYAQDANHQGYAVLNISIRHLQHFIAVAEALHFRRAAQLSNVAQPALSRSVQTLESELGVQLLTRNNRNVKLTAAGNEFYAGATSIVETMETTIDRSIRADQTQYGGINIGYSFTGMSGILPQLIASFEKQNAGININPIAGSSDELLERLRREEIDCCFMTAPIDETVAADIESVPFQSDAFVVIVNHNHPLAKHGVISVEQLATEKIILSAQPMYSIYTEHVRQFLHNAGVEPRIDYIDQNYASVLGLTAFGRGISIVTNGYGCQNAERLCILKLAGTDARLPMIMAWRKGKQSNAVITFRKYVVLYLAEQSTSVNQPTLQDESLELD